jgi:hypothetical protein
MLQAIKVKTPQHVTFQAKTKTSQEPQTVTQPASQEDRLTVSPQNQKLMRLLPETKQEEIMQYLPTASAIKKELSSHNNKTVRQMIEQLTPQQVGLLELAYSLETRNPEALRTDIRQNMKTWNPFDLSQSKVLNKLNQGAVTNPFSAAIALHEAMTNPTEKALSEETVTFIMDNTSDDNLANLSKVYDKLFAPQKKKNALMKDLNRYFDNMSQKYLNEAQMDSQMAMVSSFTSQPYFGYGYYRPYYPSYGSGSAILLEGRALQCISKNQSMLNKCQSYVNRIELALDEG